jgi:predicted Zn-dependent protease
MSSASARESPPQPPIANWDFTFFVLDVDEVNAFTPGGGYVYIHRSLLIYLSSEADLASVLVTRSATT